MFSILANQSLFDNLLKIIGVLGGFGTFVWTVYTWREKSRSELAASAADADRARTLRIIEATKPFLDRQLELYTVATRVAAVIATSDKPDEIEQAMARFLELYSGELALVETRDVATAMRNFRTALSGIEAKSISVNAVQSPDSQPKRLPEAVGLEREGLVQLSLNLAKACRNSLAQSWHVDEWKNPEGTT